jgi:endonuclease G
VPQIIVNSAPVGHDSPSRPDPRLTEVRADPAQAWRSESFERKRSYVQRHGGTLPASANEAAVDAALERIFNKPDFLPSLWLTAGAKAADAVARLVTPREKGTGFLVSPWMLLTNNHVLPDAGRAAGTEVTLRFVEDERGRVTRSQKLRLDPDRCFVTSPKDRLDYTLVAVAPSDNGKPPGKVFGMIPMRGPVGKILSGHPVNIVQHPDGRPREIAVRNNLLIGVDDARYVTYETDSEPGSSGSPVMNDAWELVALHSRAESARNDKNEPIDIGGQLVTDDTPESRRVWVANKGIRVSAIIADLSARTLNGGDGVDAGALIKELLATGGNA